MVQPAAKSVAMEVPEDPTLNERRSAEFGVVGAEQQDESHYDDRSSDGEDEEGIGAEGRIRFSEKKLYGREKEFTRLSALCDTMMNLENVAAAGTSKDDNGSNGNGMPCTAFISAYSGAGKSSLVQEFVKRRNASGSFLFLSAKYQTLQTTAPFSAFSDLFDSIDLETRNKLFLLKGNIAKAMGDDVSILVRMFPGLGELLGWGGNTSDDGEGSLDGSLRTLELKQKQKISRERFMFAFLTFFRVLCTKEHPVLLFLDDLQRADAPSLELIQVLLTNQNLRYLFFFGAYRSNEVLEGDMLFKVMRTIHEMNSLGVERLELEQLSVEDVEEFIADSLRLEREDVRTLAQAVFTKTLGNPFFTRQALEQLVRRNALYYDKIMFCWSWNLDRLQLEELISDDIVDMVKHKICHLSEELQRAMIVASYIKSSFDVKTLLDLLGAMVIPGGEETTNRQVSSKKDLIAILDEAVEEGLLVRGGKSAEEYSFSHDRIEEAARSLVPEEDRSDFLRQVGLALYQRACSEDGEDWMFFTAARHLNSTSSLTKDGEERLNLANLNLRTAELSVELLAFSAAADFCKQGICCLPDDMWKSQYKLALPLYVVGAEAEYGAGNPQKAWQYCEEALKEKQKNTSIFDVLPFYKIQVDILAATGGHKESFRLCFHVLEEMGLKFPTQESRALKMRAWAALKLVKARGIPTEEGINDMPEVTDPDIVDTMEFLQKAGSIAYRLENVSLYVLVCCESLHWMTKHGLVDSSASIISSLANILTHVYGDFDLGPKLAELAIAVSSRLKQKFNEPRTLNTAGALVLGWVRPLRTCMEYHMLAYKSGLVSGNLDGASTSKMYYSWALVYAGFPLAEIEAFCRASVPELRRTESHYNATLICHVWQLCLNLMGHSEKTIVLTGKAMDETQEPHSKPPLLYSVQVWQRFLCCFFGCWEEGAKNAFENGDILMQKFLGLMYGLEGFHRGMCLYGMAREGDSRYNKPAQRILKEMKDLVKKGCVNLEGPKRLLQGEQAALSKNRKKAKVAFEDAISICRDREFYHYAALASERYANYLMETGDREEAHRCIQNAITWYRQWGAKAKVELLQKEHNLVEKENPASGSCYDSSMTL